MARVLKFPHRASVGAYAERVVKVVHERGELVRLGMPAPALLLEVVEESPTPLEGRVDLTPVSVVEEAPHGLEDSCMGGVNLTRHLLILLREVVQHLFHLEDVGGVTVEEFGCRRVVFAGEWRYW